MKMPPLLRPATLCAAVAVLLAGCGGGGGGDGNPGVPPGGSAAYAQDVAGCSPGVQRSFVRAYLDEVYLWYDEIPAVDPSDYRDVRSYFNALLVRTPDATGQPKDRFSAAVPTSQALDLTQATGSQQAGSLLQSHTDAVPVTTVFTRPGGRKVGYIQFNDHEVGAQDDLIAAFQQLKTAAVQDLVLDLRANSGGYLYIALGAASMVTGPASEGKIFEQLQYSAKRQALTNQSKLLFSSKVQFAESTYSVGTTLPQLDLPRVFVLTTGTTCSASESIINSLRGIDVQVIRVGTTTCGKPYGFMRKDNCGTAYFPIEFQGSNAKGFGDYQAGFQPMCQIANSGTPGDPASDSLLGGALTYVDTGACPAGTATGVLSAAAPRGIDGQPRRTYTGRLLLPQQQPTP